MIFVDRISISFTLVFSNFPTKMDTKNLLKIIFALNCILVSFSLAQNNIQTVNVLAMLFPPFTIADSKHDPLRGIDVQIVKTIANRLDLKLIWFTSNDIKQLSPEKLM